LIGFGDESNPNRLRLGPTAMRQFEGLLKGFQLFQRSIPKTFVFGKVGEKLNDYSVF
tara:strand:+ start:1447 stop:1617 length:171 start_codon:yes stop_codon:yes gene_type:complete